MGRPSGLTRRSSLAGGGGILGAGLAAAYVSRPDAWAELPLFAETVAFTAPGVRLAVPVGQAGRVVPGSRVIAATPATDRLLAEEERWLARAAPWTRQTPYADLLTSALLDLRALTDRLPVAVAGWRRPWRYAWPRDTAFVACALAEVGHTDAAVAQLAWLQAAYTQGWPQARYHLRTRRAPDDRPAQLDGAGWLAWATVAVAGADPRALATLTPLLVRSTRTMLGAIDPRAGLPPPSMDYWEVGADRLTLGTVAPLLAGLDAAARSLPRIGQAQLAADATRAADRLRDRMHDAFGRYGYPRYPSGTRPDAAIAFLLPPIADRVDSAVLAALDRAQARMRRPAGGLAPGAGWADDGVSWTPPTGLFALAWAAGGGPARAGELLEWLARHRTTAGSLPEKVLHDGRPAFVAPLAWTAALVVLAVHRLGGAGAESGAGISRAQRGSRGSRRSHAPGPAR